MSTSRTSSPVEFLYVPPELDVIPVGSITTVAGIGLYLAEGRAATEAPFSVPVPTSPSTPMEAFW